METSATYKYEPTFATKVQPSYTGYIYYSFPGKENEPNLILRKNQISAKFVSKNLFIFSKIHDFLPNMADQKFDAELVIEHTPIVNSDRPIYLCIPLKNDPSAPKNILCNLLDSAAPDNLDIDLTPILPLDGSESGYYYETPYSSIIVLQTPIAIPANFVGFTRGKIDDLWALPATPIYTIPISKSSKGHFGSNIEGMENMVVLDCNYSDVDAQSEVPVYMVSAASKKDEITAKEKSLNQTISIIWLLLIALVTFFLTPVLFGLLARTIVDDAAIALSNVNSLEAFIAQILFIPAIIMISVGSSNNMKCKDDDTKCIETANGVIVPGTIMAGVAVLFIGSLAWNKYASPNFIGYRDVGKTIPYYSYKAEDIKFWHLINPMAFFIVVTIIKKFI